MYLPAGYGLAPYVPGDLIIDCAERLASVAGRAVALTGLGHQMLINHQLLQRVWGPDKTCDSGLVRSTIKRLRRKLGDFANNPTFTLNEPRVGYSIVKAVGHEMVGKMGGRPFRSVYQCAIISIDEPESVTKGPAREAIDGA